MCGEQRSDIWLVFMLHTIKTSLIMRVTDNWAGLPDGDASVPTFVEVPPGRDVNLDESIGTTSAGVPGNLIEAIIQQPDQTNDSVRSASTSSSTRRRNQELERQNAELRRQLAASNSERSPSEVGSRSSASTASSTRQQNQDLQRENAKLRRALEVALCEANLGESCDLVPFKSSANQRKIMAACAPNQQQVQKTKGIAFQTRIRWVVIGGILFLVILVGAAIYYFVAAGR